jgi:hypothetical protein
VASGSLVCGCGSAVAANEGLRRPTDEVKFIAGGVILLAAVTLDRLARRRQVVAGR